jgi:hypothetical protein
MWEEGVPNKDHQEFSGRITYMTARDVTNHANAVAAVMLGAGVKTNAQGVAPQATLHAYSYHDYYYWQNFTDVAGDDLIHFSNHSYHFPEVQKRGLYTYISTNRDYIVYTAYYHLPVMTVSNLGNKYDYGTMANGVAKNVLSVGAVAEIPGGYAGTNSVVLAITSGRGPTEDGRIKPDVVAGGWSGWIPHKTITNEYDEIGEYGKTSFAAPAVTGSLGLLQELHENLSTNVWLASTWKALLIHTADEAGDAPGPDYRFGWGLVNVHGAAELIAEDAQWGGGHFIKEYLPLHEGATSVFEVESDGNGELKITIVWTDPLGPSLINDLDLRIIDPDGTVYYPYILNPDSPGSAATTGDNSLDNVEQVVVTNTVEGDYTVMVTHKGTLVDGGQDFPMILSESPHPDPTLHLSISTNELPRLTWEANPGTLQTVMSSDDLRSSANWTAISTQVINYVTNEWVDPAGFSDEARFYRINDIH